MSSRHFPPKLTNYDEDSFTVVVERKNPDAWIKTDVLMKVEQ